MIQTGYSIPKNQNSALPFSELSALFVLAVASGTAAILFFRSHSSFGDSDAYIYAARYLIDHRSYPDWTDLFTFRAPGYPFFLAVVTLGHPESMLAGRFANVFLHGVSTLLFSSLAATTIGRRKLALLAAVVYAVHPAFLYLVTGIQSEPLFLFLALSSGLCLLRAADRGSGSLSLLAGACFSLAALTRPACLAIAPLLVGPLFDQRHSMRRRVLLTATALAGAALFLGPWTIRNELRYHAFLPVDDAAGFNLYLGNSDWTVAFYRIRDRRDYDRWNRAYIDGFPSRWIREVPGARDANPARRNRALARAAWQWARAHSGVELQLLSSKLRDWLRPWPNPVVWGPFVVVSIGVYYAVLFVLAGVGLLRGRRRGIALAAVFVLGASTVAHVLMFVTWRYRSPFWDPVLILYAAAALAPTASQSQAETPAALSE